MLKVVRNNLWCSTLALNLGKRNHRVQVRPGTFVAAHEDAISSSTVKESKTEVNFCGVHAICFVLGPEETVSQH